MNANEWMNALGFKIQLQALLKISPKTGVDYIGENSGRKMCWFKTE